MPQNQDSMIISDIPEFVRFIILTLKESGYEAYLVGGAVRDACLRRPIGDWDVVTSASRENIIKTFQDKKYFALKHETVTLVDSGQNYEVTSFRDEKSCLEGDLGLRDFTIDAMAYDVASENILDPHGGRRDISDKLVRAVGKPERRIREDPLRLLRAVRLSAELGFKIETKTLEGLKGQASLIASVAPERQREELMNILLCRRPSTGFNLMVRTGLMQHVLPELLEGYLKRQNEYHKHTIFKHVMQTIDELEQEPVLRLTGLLHDIAKPRVREKVKGKWQFLGHEEESACLADEIMNRFKFSKDLIHKVTHLIRHHMICYEPVWGDAAIRRFIHRVGEQNALNLLAFRRADLIAHGMEVRETDLLSELGGRIKGQISESPPIRSNELAIDGFLVMETLGLSPGPEVGNILRELLELVIDSPKLNKKERLIEELRRIKRRKHDHMA
jgi:tRNA nucleotidyltransferase (CCA-adding enzyme)